MNRRTKAKILLLANGVERRASALFARSLICFVAILLSPCLEAADWSGLPAQIIGDGRLQVVILPQQGASVVSFRDQKTLTEWLWELPANRISWAHGMPNEYELGGGIEDAFPTLALVAPHDGEAGFKFFGQVWNKSWAVEDSTPTSLTCSYQSPAPAYRLTKQMVVESGKLTVSYTWRNLSSRPMTALWIEHALFTMDNHTTIELDRGTLMRVHSWIKDGIEKMGGTFSWPIFDLEKPPRDVEFVSSATTGRSDKFYVLKWKHRQVTLRRKSGSSITLQFGNTISSLGIWLDQKAFPFTDPKLSIIGLEPATSPYEGLSEATQHNEVMRALPHEAVQWTYSIGLN